VRVKLTEYGSASSAEFPSYMNKEDERSTALAIRARQGDYDEGETARIPALEHLTNEPSLTRSRT
jgi:hypothetical protein